MRNNADSSDTSAIFTNTSDELVLRTGGSTDSLKINTSWNATFAGDVSAANGFYPDADDGAQLGNASLRFSELFAVRTITGGVFETGLRTQ